MPRKLLQLGNDYVLDIRFKANQIRTENGFSNEWVDEQKKKAKGKDSVDRIHFFIEHYNQEGNSTFSRVYLNVSDIKELAKRIEEIESVEFESEPFPEDLPF